MPAAETYPPATEFFPERLSLAALSRRVQECRACPLYQDATQAVFGEGPASARLMLVGEVPGDQEDRRGHPFVGPAGALLDRVLEEVGLSRGEVFVTNAVKHFKFTVRGTRRIHDKPSRTEVSACMPWFEAEVTATYHPSAVLRARDEDRARLYDELRADLEHAAGHYRSLDGSG